MQKWKVSKVHPNTGYRLAGRSERNSAGPTLDNTNRAGRDGGRRDGVGVVGAGIAALGKQLTSFEEQLSEAPGCMMNEVLEGIIKNIKSEIKLKESVLENMSRDRSLSPDPSSSSASGVDLTREVTPGPIESIMSSSSPSSSPEDHLQAEDLPDHVSVGTEEDPNSESTSNTGSSCSLDNDYGYEPYLAVNANLFHDVLKPRVQDVQKLLSKETFPKVEKKLKAGIEFRKMLNQRFRARLAQIGECKKYAATLKRLEQELNAARAETHVLEGSMMQAVETVDDSLDEWAKLAGKWVVE